MRPHFLASSITLVLAALFTSSLIVGGQGSGSSSPKKLYQNTGAEGGITGTISFTGEAPEPREIDVTADPVCGDLNPHPWTEDVIVNNGKLGNVFLYVKGGDVLDAYSFEQPASPVTLEHKGCRYEPRLLGMRTGQPLNILNSDNTAHNTHPNPKNNPEWNRTQLEGAPAMAKTFALPETFIPFRDNQHPWEKAFVGVFTHPFFAVSDRNGAYKIEGLPPGKYTLVAWHERFGENSVDIIIAPGEVQNLDFTFAAPF